MTLEQFLDEYVPKVLRPMGGWEVDPAGRIRRGVCCPLTAETGLPGTRRNGMRVARELGWKDVEALRVMGAADWRSDAYLWPHATRIRARLLAGLGLEEAS